MSFMRAFCKILTLPIDISVKMGYNVYMEATASIFFSPILTFMKGMRNV